MTLFDRAKHVLVGGPGAFGKHILYYFWLIPFSSILFIAILHHVALASHKSGGYRYIACGSYDRQIRIVEIQEHFTCKHATCKYRLPWDSCYVNVVFQCENGNIDRATFLERDIFYFKGRKIIMENYTSGKLPYGIFQ